MKLSLFFAATAALLLLAPTASAQDAPARGNDEARVSPNASVMQTIGTTNVTVHYGRPSVRGRDIFGGLEPYGQVWRTGANEATTISFSAPITIGGTEVPAGTYSLFTIPEETSWTVILNSTAEQWGAYGYDPAQDVARTTVAVRAAPSETEQFEISFDSVTDTNAMMVMAWDDVVVQVALTAGG
ncbi:MAG: DUF2911 domain-containing protein [Bacteroidota bacterium]